MPHNSAWKSNYYDERELRSNWRRKNYLVVYKDGRHIIVQGVGQVKQVGAFLEFRRVGQDESRFTYFNPPYKSSPSSLILSIQVEEVKEYGPNDMNKDVTMNVNPDVNQSGYFEVAKDPIPNSPDPRQRDGEPMQDEPRKPRWKPFDPEY